jgi:gliding motility-associated lipoprotein GldH
MRNLVFLMMTIVMVTSCKSSTDIKEIRDFNDNIWSIAKAQVFEFEIKDTVSTFNFNYLIRNAISYPFYNLYLNQKLLDPSGKVMYSSMDEIILFNQKTGEPYGDGLGDIFDNRLPAPKLSNVKFNKAGKYKWIIGHNMRPDPLFGIMSLGIEVMANKPK